MQPMTTVLLVVGIIMGALVFILAIEIKTLADEEPGNHITAAMRKAFKKQAGIFMLIWGFLNYIVGSVMGHIFWE